MKRSVLVLMLSLFLALPAFAVGRYDVILQTADYDSGDVVMGDYLPVPYNSYKAAGIIPGDRILNIKGRKVGSPRDFNDIMDSLKPNEKVKVKVLRVGKEMELMLEPAPEDFFLLNSLGKAITNGKKVKMAVIVLNVSDERDGTDRPGGRVEEARGFWSELPYNVLGDMIKRGDYGKYAGLLSLSDPGLSREAAEAFKDRPRGALTPAERAIIKDKTGATHAVTVDYRSTIPEPEKVLNSVDLAIIDLSSGAVVGKAKIETLYDAVTGKEIKSTVDGYEKKHM